MEEFDEKSFDEKFLAIPEREKEHYIEKAFESRGGQIVRQYLGKAPDVFSDEDACNVLKTLQAVTKMLKAIEEYENAMLVLRMLEIEAFEKIAEYVDSGGTLNEVKNVDKAYRNAASYYVSLNKEERKKAVHDAEYSGRSFVSFVGRLEREEYKEAYEKRLCAAYDLVVNEYRKCGCVKTELKIYGSKVSPKTKEQEKMLDAAENRLRDSLLNLGAIGVGGKYYVSPDTASHEEIVNALEIRCKSVVKDLLSIKKLMYLRNLEEIPDDKYVSAVMRILGEFAEEISECPRSAA